MILFIKKRFLSARGITILEMLITVSVLSMITAAAAFAVPTVQSAYDKTILSSNSQLLLNTAILALRNELGTARNVSVTEDEVSFYNEELNSEARIRKADPDDPEKPKDRNYYKGTILYQRYGNGEAEQLLSGSSYQANLYVTYRAVSTSGSIVTFYDLAVVDPAREEALICQNTISIRTGG